MSEKEEVKQEGTFKIKKKPNKPKKFNKKEEAIKVDLSKKEKDVTEEEPIKVVIDEKPKGIDEPKGNSESTEDKQVEQEQEQKQEGKVIPIQEITKEEIKEVKEVEQELKEAVRDEKVVGKPLPDNI
jgi:hypothetical protein